MFTVWHVSTGSNFGFNLCYFHELISNYFPLSLMRGLFLRYYKQCTQRSSFQSSICYLFSRAKRPNQRCNCPLPRYNLFRFLQSIRSAISYKHRWIVESLSLWLSRKSMLTFYAIENVTRHCCYKFGESLLIKRKRFILWWIECNTHFVRKQFF